MGPIGYLCTVNQGMLTNRKGEWIRGIIDLLRDTQVMNMNTQSVLSFMS
jgi:hypothetical protein